MIGPLPEPIRRLRCTSNSPDRKGEHPQSFLKSYSDLLQADAYSGFGQLY
jgi:hypothetical protein